MALVQDDSLSTEEETLTLKLHEILTDSDNDVGQFCFKEETIEKLMQELYKEITASPTSPKPPSPNPTLFSSSSNASLVVQVDPQDGSMGLEVGHDQKTDEGDFDEEWLARVLGWSQGQVLDTTDWF
ncbi:unnamed protein product [Sphenostylis stenocarpa]|uniref:Uncharacterized protein n=1 Tax=Sphenostylis stenocarpa TaxID=92480 RepID=A0AA86T355_9FABA|nr:unnamed protein product [Sphenostylis stenocarpa]